MAVLSDLYFKKETLETMLKVLNAKQQNGLSITIAINDDVRIFEHEKGEILQNVSAWVSQSKEEKDSGKEKYYVGNGKVFWHNDVSVLTAKEIREGQTQQSEPVAGKQGNHDDNTDDLPF